MIQISSSSGHRSTLNRFSPLGLSIFLFQWSRLVEELKNKSERAFGVAESCSQLVCLLGSGASDALSLRQNIPRQPILAFGGNSPSRHCLLVNVDKEPPKGYTGKPLSKRSQDNGTLLLFGGTSLITASSLPIVLVDVDNRLQHSPYQLPLASEVQDFLFNVSNSVHNGLRSDGINSVHNGLRSDGIWIIGMPRRLRRTRSFRASGGAGYSSYTPAYLQYSMPTLLQAKLGELSGKDRSIPNASID
ncbi:hypothetical protein EV361DRAFT_866723 [Lentinula raphanica]|nr:hypothetical protein EV361DRAFT_866723 [Lentinula raphanica]